jgi:hypothetical protein
MSTTTALPSISIKSRMIASSGALALMAFTVSDSTMNGSPSVEGRVGVSVIFFSVPVSYGIQHKPLLIQAYLFRSCPEGGDRNWPDPLT